MVLTRLHARYGKTDVPDDLQFQKATPIVGGREYVDGGLASPANADLAGLTAVDVVGWRPTERAREILDQEDDHREARLRHGIGRYTMSTHRDAGSGPSTTSAKIAAMTPKPVTPR